MKNEVVKIFDDLDALLDYCRFNLVDYNPADLYNRNSKVWRDFEYSKKPKRQWNNDKPRYNNGDKPRYNKEFQNRPRWER